MKRILLALCVFSFSVNSSAQSDSSYLDVGVNIIRIINMGVGAQNLNPDVWNPYMFTLDAHYKRIGARVGIGHRSVQNNELPTEANGLTTFEMDTTRTDVRLGLNWDVHLNPKWTFKLGLDYVKSVDMNRNATEFTNENNDVVETEHKIERIEKGIAPFVFVQYHITPRMSVGTELSWRITSFTMYDRDTSNLNDANIERKYEGIRRSVMAPTALFLNVRF